MAELSNHVSVSITTDTVGVPRQGFGVLLLCSKSASWSGDLVREYASLSEVAVDFATTTSPEYLAAQAYFAQTPKPRKLKIAKMGGPVAQVYSLAYTVASSTAYTITVGGEGVTTETVTFTSDSSATDGEIATGITAALESVTGENYAVSGSATPLTITADAASDWISIQAADPTLIKLSQTHAATNIAANLTSILNEDDEWYGLYMFDNSNAVALAAAAWCESNKRLFIADINEQAAITTAAGNSDTLDDFATADYEYTMGWYAPNPLEMRGAAFAGRWLPTEPGAATAKYKQLAGITADTLTSTQRGYLTARAANFVETVATLKITAEGTRADGNFVDLTRNVDWLTDDMSKGVFELLAGADIVPFTDLGISAVVAKVRRSLERAVAKGILSPDVDFVVEYPAAADVSTANKSTRTLPDVKWSATLAGAIHSVTISGVVSV